MCYCFPNSSLATRHSTVWGMWFLRSSVLRRWLLEFIGIDTIRSGCVLDVAGGKGELAWELLNLNRVESVVLDPRPLDLKQVERKWRHGFFWRNPIFHRFLHCTFDSSVEPQTPQHLRLLLTEALLSGESDAFEESKRRAAELSWTRKGLVHTALQEESETTEGAFLEALRRCSAVVALHPDQAAELSIRLALQLQMPFAVVPCCVYAQDFPKRKLADGRPVRTYEELLEYLQLLDPRIQRTQLDFEGKSILLFMTPNNYRS